MIILKCLQIKKIIIVNLFEIYNILFSCEADETLKAMTRNNRVV